MLRQLLLRYHFHWLLRHFISTFRCRCRPLLFISITLPHYFRHFDYFIFILRWSEQHRHYQHELISPFSPLHRSFSKEVPSISLLLGISFKNMIILHRQTTPPPSPTPLPLKNTILHHNTHTHIDLAERFRFRAAMSRRVPLLLFSSHYHWCHCHYVALHVKCIIVDITDAFICRAMRWWLSLLIILRIFSHYWCRSAIATCLLTMLLIHWHWDYASMTFDYFADAPPCIAIDIFADYVLISWRFHFHFRRAELLHAVCCHADDFRRLLMLIPRLLMLTPWR